MSGTGECSEKYIKYYPAAPHVSEPLGCIWERKQTCTELSGAATAGLLPKHDKG